jgi:hypothetical protein
MADQSKVMKQTIMEYIQKKLNEFSNDPKPIIVTLREDDYDLFDQIGVTNKNGEVSINSKDYDYYLKNKNPKDIVTVPYDLETSYIGFHYYAWKELTMFEKTLTVMWFHQVLGQKSNKTPASIVLNPYINNAMEHTYSKEVGDYILTINPLMLEDKNKAGFQFMEELMFYNFQDDLNLAMSELNDGVNKDRFNKMVLANCLKPVKKPENFQSYLYGETVTKEEEQQIALYASQPIELARRIMMEEMSEYMQLCQEAVGVPDSDWDLYKAETDDFNKMLDTLFQHHFKQDQTQTFEKLLNNELTLVNNILSAKEQLEK